LLIGYKVESCYKFEGCVSKENPRTCQPQFWARSELSLSSIITDTWRWNKLASAPMTNSFANRAELASLFIRPGDVVCDLGAGAQPLKAFLPEGAAYVAVDCVDTIPGTHVADFNRPDFSLPAADFNVIAALGLFAYIVDLEAFLARLSVECEGKFIIFSYDFWKLNKWYLTHGVHNGIEELDEGVALFSKYVRDLTAVAITRRRVMFTGVLGQSAPAKLRRRSATELTMKYVKPWEYLLVKGFGFKILPRWMA
jgi:hypothetical protein